VLTAVFVFWGNVIYSCHSQVAGVWEHMIQGYRKIDSYLSIGGTNSNALFPGSLRGCGSTASQTKKLHSSDLIIWKHFEVSNVFVTLCLFPHNFVRLFTQLTVLLTCILGIIQIICLWEDASGLGSWCISFLYNTYARSNWILLSTHYYRVSGCCWVQ
jgi:hypothetical protein